METSKEIIEQATQKFKELKHKNYDWSSFYNGFLEAKALSMRIVMKQGKYLICDVNNKKTICENPLSHECCNKHHKRI